MTEPVRIYPRHIHEAGLCMSGARAWFKRHDLAFEDCRRGQLTVDQVEATGDALGLRVAAFAREEADGRQ